MLLLVVGCNVNEKKCPTVNSCKNGTMEDAWYVFGQDTFVNDEMRLKEKFQIIVDTMRKPINFISFTEAYAKEQNLDLETNYIYLEDEQFLSAEEKEERYEQIRINYGLEADTIHERNNSKDLLVWIINNTKDTVEIQMQDWSFICIKEAKNKCNEWKPVEFWKTSFCGNSYYYEAIPPQVIKQFVANRFEGDMRVEMRFKLLGKTEYYYSNNFWGTIDSCSFQKDSTEDIQIFKMEKPLNLVI